ncbi:hypothetical protein ACVWY0_001103 [Arthrobacter sp. UYNi723]
MTQDQLSRLDQALFEPGSWRALDSSNVAVPGLVAGSMDAALEWIGTGPVATVFGRLRAGFQVIDVDLSGDRGDAVTDLVADWAAVHSRWHLIRPSGGAAGRHHVFIHVDVTTLPALREHVAQLRKSFHVNTSSIDVRTAVRPLSAPHRTGTTTTVLGGARALREALITCPEVPAAKITGRRRQIDTSHRSQHGSHEKTPLAAAPRSPANWLRAALPSPVTGRRKLPDAWDEYLAHGTRPTIGGTDHSGSTFELIATKQMVVAGYTPTQAWTAISSAHPSAMPKACLSQKRWVNNVWNHCVEDLKAFVEEHLTTARSAEQTSPEVLAIVDAARRRLHVLLWEYPVRRRDTLAAVGHAVLDRIERTGVLRVPVPERNLVLDTGIVSRPAIREALRFIDGKLGTLHRDTLDYASPESGSFEFELVPVQGGAVLESYPPRSHAPLPRSSTWLNLPRPARRLWQTLRQNGPTALTTLCRSAALPELLNISPGPSTLRTGRTALAALAAAGLASCDGNGVWTATSRVTSEHAAAAVAEATLLEEQIHAERKFYRQRQAGTWAVQRRCALAKDHARYQAWWDKLPAEERRKRQERYARTFQRLPLPAQEELKAQLATRRTAAGMSEPVRYSRWRENLSPEVVLLRTTERAAAFAALPGPLQQAAVSSWERHRARFRLPTPSRARIQLPVPGSQPRYLQEVLPV